MTKHRTRQSRQSGSSLIEVLVSMVVFAVAVTGIAALMIASMRSNDATYQRTQASILAQELYEKMLANMEAVEDGDYDRALALLPTPTGTLSPTCTLDTDNCNTEEMATADLWQWAVRANKQLNGVGLGVLLPNRVTEDPILIEVQVQYKAQRQAVDSETVTDSFFFRAKKND